jgi:hypothetical protein
MILRWSPFKNVSVSAVLYPRWPPLLKIEISSNGQNCSILSQKVPKFELYKHNDELFNLYYGIFYELWTFAYFDRLCKLEKRGDEILKKSSPLKLQSQSQPNFVEMILGNRQTHFWKRTIKWLFHQNFVLIEQMVSDKKILMLISHRVLC